MGMYTVLFHNISGISNTFTVSRDAAPQQPSLLGEVQWVVQEQEDVGPSHFTLTTSLHPTTPLSSLIPTALHHHQFSSMVTLICSVYLVMVLFFVFYHMYDGFWLYMILITRVNIYKRLYLYKCDFNTIINEEWYHCY